MAIYQFVEESDGQIYRQELSWTNGEGFTGRHNPENVDFVPKGAAKLHLVSLEWEPVTHGEIVIEAFIAGPCGVGGLFFQSITTNI